jgi:chorismate--pyruvate lyase
MDAVLSHTPSKSFKPGTLQLTEPKWKDGGNMRLQLQDWQQDWLLDTGSLTKRLIEASDGQFRVAIQRQALLPTYLSEAKLLDIDPRQLALVREVILFGREQAWVFARSIIPQNTLTGRLRALKNLDNRPLGQLLFNDPSMRRDPIEVAKVEAQHRFLPKHLSTQSTHWGRRSRFFLDDKAILVSEVFLDRPQ